MSEPAAVILYYDGTRQAVLNEIRHFSWQEAERTTALPAHSSRALNREFEEKLWQRWCARPPAPCFSVSIADCPHSLAHDPLCAERTALPAAPPHQGGAAGCPVYFHFCLQKGTSEPPEWSMFLLEVGELLEE